MFIEVQEICFQLYSNLTFRNYTWASDTILTTKNNFNKSSISIRRCGTGNGVYEVFLDLVFLYVGETSLPTKTEVTIATFGNAKYTPSYASSVTVYVGSSGSQGVGHMYKDSRTVSITPYAREIVQWETIHLVFGFESNVA